MDDIGLPYDDEDIEKLTIINNLVARISKGEGKYCSVDYDVNQVVYSDTDEIQIKHDFESLDQCIDMLLDIYSKVNESDPISEP